ncbi:MAG: type VII secretion-associated protein, partial [Mycobacteriaceae bacterium]
AELDLTPDGTPAQAQGLFLVQTTLNPAISQADVAAVLLKQVAAEVAAGKKYVAFNGDAHSEGRDVIYYREIRRDTGVVDWYVLVESQTQVSVGCQRPADDQHSMDQPCAQAVRTVRIAGG